MPRGNQLTRQWRLLQLLDRPAGIAVDDAARDLACAVRTIWRDLRVLQEAGFPIYDDAQADGRRSAWRLEEAFRLRLPLKLSLSEVAALLMSRELAMPAGAAGLGGAVGSAFEKIAGLLSKDRLWHPTQQFREADGGRLEMTLRVADTLGVRRWILGFGPDAEVVAPASLRDALRAAAEALARKLAPERVPPAEMPGLSEPAAPLRSLKPGTRR